MNGPRFRMPLERMIRNMRSEYIEDLGYGHANIFFEERPESGSFQLVDFNSILEGMESIYFNGLQQTYLVTRLEGDTTELKGSQALAFRRYLNFLGIFQAIALRKYCPVCVGPSMEEGFSQRPARHYLIAGMDPMHLDSPCPECGGLAWVLDDGTAVES